MDIGELIPKLDTAVPGSVLDQRPFGRRADPSLWLELKSIDRVGAFLKDEPTLLLDWLENLSVMEIEGMLVISWFLRSTRNDNMLVLRGSALPEELGATVSLPSVSGIWPMAAPLERENATLFGMQFTSGPSPDPAGLHLQGEGFPLRKSYLFPKGTKA